MFKGIGQFLGHSKQHLLRCSFPTSSALIIYQASQTLQLLDLMGWFSLVTQMGKYLKQQILKWSVR